MSKQNGHECTEETIDVGNTVHMPANTLKTGRRGGKNEIFSAPAKETFEKKRQFVCPFLRGDTARLQEEKKKLKGKLR